MKNKIAKIGPSKNALLTELNLSQEKLKLAKQLLAEYDLNPANTYIDIIRKGNVNPTDEQIQIQTEANRQELLKNFKELLTADQFAFLEYYITTEPYRRTTNKLADDMEKATADILTPGNREAFIGLMTDGTEALRINTRGFSTVNNLEINKYMRQYFLENSGTILTPSQLNWLIKYYDKEISAYGD